MKSRFLACHQQEKLHQFSSLVSALNTKFHSAA
uniref:Uncharacterized protein LOC107404017 n=1 Tax=Rhizophora mucronata TaxID=61149 RepID=A0A2P2JNZ1_RHIMU